MAQLLSGSLDGQWVEVEGVVHSVHLSERNVTLEITTVGGSLSATTLREPGTTYESLVDSLIRIHGNAAPQFNRKGQMVGVHVFFPSLKVGRVIQEAPADPFLMPAFSIPRLLRFMPGLVVAHRVHVRGRVTLQWPGRTLCIQEASDGLCMQTVQTTPVSSGQLVDVIGFPAISEYKATLENASFRLASGGPQPLQAKLITADQAFAGDHDGELVQIEGELIGQDPAGTDLTLMLRSGKFLFPGILPRNATGLDLAQLKEGSSLRLTGVCSVLIDPEITNLGEGGVRPGSVRILLYSIGDVQVVRTPSWWTPGHAMEVLVFVGAFAFAAFAWIVVLRRRVRQQTQALRSSQERLRHLSEHDALTNLPNRILLNDRLNMALKRAERFHACLGLLMVDVDRFKEVNDAFGHHAGDLLLCELAKRMSVPVRLTDTVARIGGDEFIVLLPDLHTPGEAKSIAAKIVASVSVPIDIGPARLPVTVSVGVCTYPEGGSDEEELMRHADSAMYTVKAHGGNGSQVYGPD
jgi:diguanylate cyclase (GGDEF)-like protein